MLGRNPYLPAQRAKDISQSKQMSEQYACLVIFSSTGYSKFILLLEVRVFKFGIRRKCIVIIELCLQKR